MAKLTYTPVIDADTRFTALADLGKLDAVDNARLIPRLIELVAEADLQLIAEQRSALGFDGFGLAHSLPAKRQVLKKSYNTHRLKGTPFAIRDILRQLGFGDITLIEGINRNNYDGSITYNGTYVYGDPHKWAHYVVVLDRAITNEQAALIRFALSAYAPARCVLAAIDYRVAPILYNGRAKFDGTYNYGAA